MPATLDDMIRQLFDVQTRAIHNQVSVSNVAPPTLVAKNNPNRLSLILSNPSAQLIYVAFEQDFAVGEGILLVPNGGFVSFLWSEDFNVVGWSMHGIAVAAAGNLNVLEIVSL